MLKREILNGFIDITLYRSKCNLSTDSIFFTSQKQTEHGQKYGEQSF